MKRQLREPNFGWKLCAAWAAALLLMSGAYLYAQTAQDAAKAPPAAPAQPAPADTPAGEPTAGDKPAGNPVFVCDELEHNFGEFWSGPKVKHTFQIKNTGTDTLKLLNVKPGCGCTAVEFTKEIPPGGEGVIPCTLDTKNLKHTFNKVINVTTNDPANASLTLKLTGDAKPYVNIDPGNVAFGKIKYDEDINKSVKITNNWTEPLTLELVQDPAPGQFSVELREVTPGMEFELVVKGNKPYKEGLNRANIRMKTNLTEQPEISVQAMANLPPRLELNKTSILIPKSQNTPLTHSVRVTNNGDKPIKVTSATIDDPAVTTTVSEKEGGVYMVEATFPADYLPPEAGTKLVIHTDDADKPTLDVPVKRTDARAQAPTPPGKKKPMDELVGQKAPAVQLASESGTMVDTANPEGKVMILDFVTAWCPHCKKQSPVLNDLYQTYYKDNPKVQFAVVSQDSNDPSAGKRAKTPDEVKKIFGDLGVTMDLVLDSQKKMGGPFKANSFPALVVVGKTGEVEAVHSGEKPNLKEILKEQIDMLLEGKTHKDFPNATASAPPARTAPAAPAPSRPTVITPGSEFTVRPAPKTEGAEAKKEAPPPEDKKPEAGSKGNAEEDKPGDEW